jgi:hypothetical protein
MNLPELPPFGYGNDGLSADDAREYGRQCFVAAMEQAAVIADALDCAHKCGVGAEVAAAIRAAK